MNKTKTPQIGHIKEFQTPEVTHKGQSLFAIKMGANLTASQSTGTRIFYTVKWELHLTMRKLSGAQSKDTSSYRMKFVDPQDLLAFANGLEQCSDVTPVAVVDFFKKDPDNQEAWVVSHKEIADSTSNVELMNLMVKTLVDPVNIPTGNFRYIFPKREYYSAFRDTSKGNYGANKIIKQMSIDPLMPSENKDMAITDMFTKNMDHIIGISYFETEIAGTSKEKTKRNIFIPMSKNEARAFADMIRINYTQLNNLINNKIYQVNPQ